MQVADDFKHKGLRKAMVERLKARGIHDVNVLSVMEKIPRHFFLNSSFSEKAYEDIAFQIGAKQTISHPYTVAFQSQLLQVKRGDKILEIGTGSGYQASVLCEMGARVFSIERQRVLFDKTKEFLNKLGYTKLKLYYGDGYKGLPAFAPFDKIIITAGAPEVPQALLAQLKIGGIMVIPVGEEEQLMFSYYKKGENQFEVTEHGNFRFVPMLEDKANDHV